MRRDRRITIWHHQQWDYPDWSPEWTQRALSSNWCLRSRPRWTMRKRHRPNRNGSRPHGKSWIPRLKICSPSLLIICVLNPHIAREWPKYPTAMQSVSSPVMAQWPVYRTSRYHSWPRPPIWPAASWPWRIMSLRIPSWMHWQNCLIWGSRAVMAAPWPALPPETIQLLRSRTVIQA